MSDRVKALTVVLKEDVRQDDVEALVNAIRLFTSVISVKVVKTTMDDYFARERVRHELGEKIWAVLYPADKDK
jgi:hypothetical protein